MKPRYVLVNEFEKEKFEKEWQLPYGYAVNEHFISHDAAYCINLLHRLVDSHNADPNDYVIEKISEEGSELYYRI